MWQLPGNEASSLEFSHAEILLTSYNDETVESRP